MASTVNNKKPCSKCGSKGWVFLCDGCEASFCVKHAADHRNELTDQLDNIQKQYDHLQHIYNQHEKRQEHPLFSQIDVWEHDTIAKIQQTAQTARDELRQLLNESNDRMKTILNQFNDQLHTERENDHYTEIELGQWKEQLMNIRKQLETPCDIELIPDNNFAPIHLIKVNATKQNTMIRIPSFAQPNELCEDTDDIDCCSDDELDKPSSNIQDISENSTIEAVEQNEPSTIPKEEHGTLCNLPDVLSNEPRSFLDPTKNNSLVLLQLSSSIQPTLSLVVSKLIDGHCHVFNDKDDCLNGLKQMGQSTIFIDVSNISSDDRNHLLDNISELDDVHFIYIRGNPPEDDTERDHFFKRYTRIKSMLDNEQRLVVQWAIDTVNEYKRTGDMYIELNNKDTARRCYEQGITLYKRLSVFLNEKRRVH